MIKFIPNAMTGIAPVLNAMIANGYMPETIRIVGDNGESGDLTIEPTYNFARPFTAERWKSYMSMAWSNGWTTHAAELDAWAREVRTPEAFDTAWKARLRLNGHTIFIDLPDEYQAFIDQDIVRIEQAWAKALAESFIECQRRRIHEGGYTVEDIIEQYPSLAGSEAALMAPWQPNYDEDYE